MRRELLYQSEAPQLSKGRGGEDHRINVRSACGVPEKRDTVQLTLGLGRWGELRELGHLPTPPPPLMAIVRVEGMIPLGGTESAPVRATSQNPEKECYLQVRIGTRKKKKKEGVCRHESARESESTADHE